jgi:hypothetical protein
MTSDRSQRDGATAPETGAPAGETRRDYVPRQGVPYEEAREAETSSGRMAQGLTLAAAVLLMVGGTWNFLEGLAGIIRQTTFIVLPNYVYSLSSTGWGVFHLVLGAVVFLVGLALLTDNVWARAAGVFIAAMSAIVNFLFIPYQSVWSFLLIGIDAVIIWALLTPRGRTRHT